MPTNETTKRVLPPLPAAQPNALAARAFGMDAPALVARIREMTAATRRAARLARVPFSREAESDGVKISASRLARYERMTERSEIDLFTTLWLMARGGYTWQDVYPPLAGVGRLTEDEAELLRSYRASKPFARPSIRQYASLMAREDTGELLPGNVHALPRPPAHPQDELARDQALHEGQAEIHAAIERIDARVDERQQAKRRRPRKFYGSGGNGNGKA